MPAVLASLQPESRLELASRQQPESEQANSGLKSFQRERPPVVSARLLGAAQEETSRPNSAPSDRMQVQSVPEVALAWTVPN